MFLVFLMAVIAVIDFKQSKIPNWCILIGAAAGIAKQISLYGAGQSFQILIQIFVIFICFYPFYLVKGLGAGDVKLFMMLGCFFDQNEILTCLLLTFVFAAIKCMVSIFFYPESRKRLIYLMGYLKKVCMTKMLDEYEWDKTNKRNVVRLAIPAFFSVLVLYGGKL